MRAAAISVGDTLKLKKDNPYGLAPQDMTVIALRCNPGYTTPFVYVAELDAPYNALRPKDFSGRA